MIEQVLIGKAALLCASRARVEMRRVWTPPGIEMLAVKNLQTSEESLPIVTVSVCISLSNNDTADAGIGKPNTVDRTPEDFLHRQPPLEDTDPKVLLERTQSVMAMSEAEPPHVPTSEPKYEHSLQLATEQSPRQEIPRAELDAGPAQPVSQISELPAGRPSLTSRTPSSRAQDAPQSPAYDAGHLAGVTRRQYQEQAGGQKRDDVGEK